MRACGQKRQQACLYLAWSLYVKARNFECQAVQAAPEHHILRFALVHFASLSIPLIHSESSQRIVPLPSN